MSSFVWMKVLESAPQRCDCGIRMLSCGRIQQVYDRIAELVAAPGKRILDIGCGTGGVSLACAALGATVTGIDINAGMLEVARSKPVPGGGIVAFLELGAAEIGDRFAEGSLDAIVACLAVSELSADDQDYTLRLAHSRPAHDRKDILICCGQRANGDLAELDFLERTAASGAHCPRFEMKLVK